MTNNPRDPLPGQEPGQPQDPRQQPLGESAEQRAGNQPSQQQPGRPGQQMPASGAGETPATGSTASGMPASSSGSGARGYQSPQQGQQTSQSYQRTEPAYQTTRAAPPPRKSNRNLALFGILGLLAVGGIIAGFAATNNSNTSPAAAIHRPLPAHRLLANFSGTGPRFSAPFVVTGSPVTARYSYVCGSGTAAHHFSAGLVAVNRTDTQIIVPSATGARGAGTTTLHPRSVGSAYRIGADSTCPYNVKVYQP
jgi:hypothetical protein